MHEGGSTVFLWNRNHFSIPKYGQQRLFSAKWIVVNIETLCTAGPSLEKSKQKKIGLYV